MTYLVKRLLALSFALAVIAGASFAQDNDVLDYTAWAERAARAEASLAEGGGSDTTLNAMRSQILNWRDRFDRAQVSNASRLQTLQSQLEALGPAPENGATEAEEVAARRTEISAELEALQAPARLAQEARTRADNIVEDIERILTNRSQPDYEIWKTIAAAAETKLENGKASGDVLEALREDIASWREEFLTAQASNATRIKTLESQLKALGPVPETGVGEATELSQRRAELEAQLARLQAPAKRADEAYTRADGIIGEIDSVIRERQTNELLSVTGSPLNPIYWPKAISALTASTGALLHEAQVNLSAEIKRGEARANLPLSLILLAIGAVLLARGWGWIVAGENRISRRAADRPAARLWRIVVSVGKVIVPTLGVAAISAAALSTGFADTRWEMILISLPIWTIMVLGIRWLAEQCFHPNDDFAILKLPHEERLKARRFAIWLALLLVLKSLLEAFGALDRFSPETHAVLNFPLLVLAGMTLFRLGRVRNVSPDANGNLPEDVGTFRLTFARLVGRGLIILGVLGPVMAAIGYDRLGNAMVYPPITTLVLIAFVLVLQRVLTLAYMVLAGENAKEHDSLMPVLGGFALTMLALPVLALIWGARIADLTELWARFREGFEFGETRISPTDFLLVIVVFIAGYMLTRMTQGALRSSVLPKTKLDHGAQNAVVSGLGYVGIFLSAIIAITTAGLDLSSVAIVAGALSVGIGFGLQTIVSNFVSGIILLIERPISEGDWIEVNGTHGTVKDISVRSTRIETFDRFDVIIPNADLVSGTVSNYTKGNVLGRLIVSVGVAYGTDTRKVEKILLDIARQHPLVLMNPAPYVYFRGFGADSMDFEIRAILSNVNNSLGARTEMNHQIVERFTEEGIEIPFAQRDIWIRNPEALPEAIGGHRTGQPDALNAGLTAAGRSEDIDGGEI